MQKLVLFTPEASDLAEGMGGAEQIEARSFPDGETYARIPVACAGKDVLLIHRCYPEPNRGLISLFILLDAIRQQSPKSLRAFVPYFPYARMDKSVKEGEAISADTICRIIKDLGCSELVTLDCHFIKTGAGVHERAGMRIKNITASGALLSLLKKSAPGALVISPDQGAAYMAQGGASMKKVRAGYDKNSGSAYRKIEKLEADFEAGGKDIIIIDDMVSTGSTMIKAVNVLKQAGAKRILCATTHGLFLNNALEKLKGAGAEEVICTSSIKSSAAKVNAASLLEGALQ